MLIMSMRISYYIQKNEEYLETFVTKGEELTKKIDDNNFIFTILTTGETLDFNGKSDPLTLLKKIGMVK